jgi:hypothetical protein
VQQAKAQLRTPPTPSRIVPLTGETTWSLMSRLAARYGLDAQTLLGHWQWRNQ